MSGANKEHFSHVEHIDLLVRFILTAPALVIVMLAPFAGGLSDKYGRKKLLTFAIVVFGIAGSAGLYLTSLWSILLSRALVGASIAFVMTISTALVADYFPAGPSRESFMSKQSAFFGLGGLFFLTLGGFLSDLGWRAPFAVYLSALILPYFIWKYLVEPSSHLLNLKGTTSYEQRDWKRAITVLLTMSFLNSLTFYLLPTQLPFLIKELNIGSSGFSGIAIGLSTLISSLASLQYMKLRKRAGFSTVFFLGFLFMSAAYLMLGNMQSKGMVIAAMIVAGLGMGIIMPNAVAASMSFAPEKLRGRVAGGLTTSIFLGQFISPLASQPWSHTFSLPQTFEHAGLLLILVSISSLVLKGIIEGRA